MNTVLVGVTDDLGIETRGGNSAALTLPDLFTAANRADRTVARYAVSISLLHDP